MNCTYAQSFPKNDQQAAQVQLCRMVVPAPGWIKRFGREDWL
jgi:hypothetical protein